MKERPEIRKGQIWQSTTSDMQVVIDQKKGGFRWKVKKLTDRTGVFNGSHTLTERTLTRGFYLLQ